MWVAGLFAVAVLAFSVLAVAMMRAAGKPDGHYKPHDWGERR